AQGEAVLLDRGFVEPAQRFLQLQPPQARRALDEADGEEHRERRTVALENRKGEIAGVAIAVVERQRGEARPALDEPSPRLLERDEFKTAPAHQAERGI